MIRAIFFDFYSVWTPDNFSTYIADADRHDPEVAQQLRQTVQQYYLGLVDIDFVADNFRFKLNTQETQVLPTNAFRLRLEDIAPALIDFMRSLHGHFLKLGVLANIGKQEYKLLTDFNTRYQLFEVITGSLNFGSLIFDQAVFVKALHDIGEPPGSCLVISGHDEYLQFAKGCGLQTLRFEGFPKLLQALDELIKDI